MEDREILQLLWKRAEEGLKALAQKYGASLRRLAMNILADARDAEECVNDTYLALWNTIPPKQPDPLGGYAHGVNRNIALTRLRDNRAQKRFSQYDLSLEELAQTLPGGTLEEQLDARELGRAINGFLGSLSKDKRDLFLRRYWFGDSIETLSEASGLRPNTVVVRLSRIRQQLKTYLEKEGFWI